MYKFWGKVKEGKNRGKILGFPTANVSLHKAIAEGIYISQTIIRNQIYPSLTFIGSSKTFNENDFLSETMILNFDQNIYNRWVTVKLIKKIRGNKKFKGESELVEQMGKDKKQAEEYFKNL